MLSNLTLSGGPARHSRQVADTSIRLAPVVQSAAFPPMRLQLYANTVPRGLITPVVIAKFLVERGGQHLVLLSRSGHVAVPNQPLWDALETSVARQAGGCRLQVRHPFFLPSFHSFSY